MSAFLAGNISEAFTIRDVGKERTGLRMTGNPAQSEFLTPSLAKSCIDVADGSPLYAYSLSKLEESANACLDFPNEYGLTVRYAMKACPNRAILQFFNTKGIHIDASSGYEVRIPLLVAM